MQWSSIAHIKYDVCKSSFQFQKYLPALELFFPQHKVIGCSFQKTFSDVDSMGSSLCWLFFLNFSLNFSFKLLAIPLPEGWTRSAIAFASTTTHIDGHQICVSWPPWSTEEQTARGLKRVSLSRFDCSKNRIMRGQIVTLPRWRP